MTIDKALFSSTKNDWETPDKLFNTLNKEFNFDVDVCADASNRKVPVYFTEDYENTKGGALDMIWHNTLIHGKPLSVAWMNPPYGKNIGRWMRKAYEESLQGVTVVCLVPSRTDTKWWHDYAMLGEIRFIKGRLTFKGAKSSAPFPSAIVVFHG